MTHRQGQWLRAVTETLEPIEPAYHNAFGDFVSHGSGETVDTIIPELTVAVGAGHLKTGSACRVERIEKFNPLMRIEKRLGKASRLADKHAFKDG